MTDIQKVRVELARPRGNFRGKVAEGWYTVHEGTVTLVEENGVPVDRYKLTMKLPPGGDARGAACRLLRSRYSTSSGDFNLISTPEILIFAPSVRS